MSKSSPPSPQWGFLAESLKLRLATAAVAVPLLILVIGWGSDLLFSGVLFLVALGALSEYFAMVLPGHRKEQVLGVLFGMALFLWLVLPEAPMSELGLGVLLVGFFSVYLVFGGGLEEKLRRLGWSLLGAFYLGYLLPYWVLLFRLPNGRAWVFLILAVIMTGDTLAFFIGRSFGRRKLAPELSPGKTLEGAVGYLAGSVLAGWLVAPFLTLESSAIEIAALSLVLGLMGQIGDLFESWLKRAFAVKDSGALLPGHGGLLDRLDSLIFPAVVTTTYLQVFHP
jgi:phosphatidate cytidylyltransferase